MTLKIFENRGEGVEYDHMSKIINICKGLVFCLLDLRDRKLVFKTILECSRGSKYDDISQKSKAPRGPIFSFSDLRKRKLDLEEVSKSRRGNECI